MNQQKYRHTAGSKKGMNGVNMIYLDKHKVPSSCPFHFLQKNIEQRSHQNTNREMCLLFRLFDSFMVQGVCSHSYLHGNKVVFS